MSEWEVKRLDEVADRVTVKNSAGLQRVLTVAAGRGLVDQETYFNKRVASADLSGYWVVEPGDFVYNKSTSKDAPWGVVARWDGDEPAVVTSLYIVFRAHPSIDSDYLLHACNGTYFFDSLRGTLREGARAHGLLNVRLAEFFGAQLVIPSPAEQRRIVDVMTAVDAQVDALGAELEAFRATQGPLISALLSQGGESWPVMKLGEIGTFTRGRRFTKADYVESGLSAIHYGQIHTDLGLITTEALTYLPRDCRDRMRLAKTGDVVIAATSENVGDLGNATVWLGSDEAAVHDDANIFKHDLDPVFAGCLFFSPEFQQQKVQYAAGTKVTRISSGNLGRIEVPIPVNRADQERIGNAVKAFSRVADAIDADLTRLRSFRSSLLTSLLNQTIEILESYNALLEGVS